MANEAVLVVSLVSFSSLSVDDESDSCEELPRQCFLLNSAVLPILSGGEEEDDEEDAIVSLYLELFQEAIAERKYTKEYNSLLESTFGPQQAIGLPKRSQRPQKKFLSHPMTR